MTTAVQHRRGTTAEHSTFTGLEGELTIDTTKDTAVIHDGALAGGYPLAKETLSNVNPSSLSTLDGASSAADDKFVVYDTSAGAMKTITRAELNNAMTTDALDTVDINGGTIDGTTIGATTASTGAFTTLTTSSTVTLNGGTANGVAYLNGSKVLTTGSALTFDGTKLNAASSADGPVSLFGVSNATTGGNATLNIAAGSTQYAFPSVRGDTVFRAESNSLVFGTASEFKWGSASAEWMRLTSTGLGIGTSSPIGRLTIQGAAGTNGIDQGIGLLYSNGTHYGALGLNNSSGWPQLMARAGAGLTFHVNSDLLTTGEAMRLDSSGNLGIGTSSPGQKLTVAGNEVGPTKINALGTSYGSGSFLNAFSSAGGNDVGFAGFIASQSLDASNRLWMGVHSPSGARQAFVGTPDATPLAFWTSSTERMRLDTSGNLGLGVTPSAWTTYKAFQVANASLWGAVNNAYVGANCYFDGSVRRYISDGFSSEYAQVSGEHRFYTAPSGTAGDAISFSQVMTLDASGNLGIGTSSPAARLSLEGSGTYLLTLNNTAQDARIRLLNNGTEGGQISASSTVLNVVGTSSIGFRTNGSLVGTWDSSGNLGLGVTPSAWGSGYKGLQVNSGLALMGSGINGNVTANAYYDGTYWRFISDGYATTYYANYANNGSHVWGVTSSGTAGLGVNGTSGVWTSAMTLDASGNLLVGTTSTNETSGTGGRFGADGYVRSTRAGSTGAASTLDVYSTGASAFRFYVDMAGTVFATNTTISAISDQRLKENVQDLDAGLDKIMALQPRKFDWKEGKGKNIKGDRGWIAQEFEQVFPDMIDTWKDEAPEGEEPYKSVRQDLIPVLVKAIQEQQAIIESLKARLDAANL